MCAIGLVIPEEIYFPGMEEKSVLDKELEDFRDKILPTLSDKELVDLQECHDTAAIGGRKRDHKTFLLEIEENLRYYAKAYNLTIPESNWMKRVILYFKNFVGKR